MKVAAGAADLYADLFEGGDCDVGGGTLLKTQLAEVRAEPLVMQANSWPAAARPLCFLRCCAQDRAVDSLVTAMDRGSRGCACLSSSLLNHEPYRPSLARPCLLHCRRLDRLPSACSSLIECSVRRHK